MLSVITGALRPEQVTENLKVLEVAEKIEKALGNKPVGNARRFG